jgi:hypothetical protein
MIINNLRPAYRVLNPAGFYADDYLWKEDETLYFDGEPNEELEPLNDKAKEKLTIYIEKLDDLARKTAEKLGRPYVGRPRDAEGALALARADELKRISLMGNQNKEKTTERIVPDAIPETSQKGRPNFTIAA